MHGYDEFRRHLTSLFPREAAGIARYCDKIREIGDSIGVEVHRSGRLSSGGVKYLGASAAEFIGECVADPLLRSVLAGTNPLYGGVRERSPLYHHAMINHSNIEGACRFAGGTQHIADALAAKIREHGGTILTGCRASALHTEGRRITGVELADGRILRAKSVISAIHPAATFGLIGPTPVLRRAFRDRMAGMPARTAFSRCICCSGRKVFPISTATSIITPRAETSGTHSSTRRPCVRKWYCSARSRRAPIRRGARW